MAKTFKLRPKTEKDLINIYRYSVREWGIEHADTYIRHINSAFQQLADGVKSGRDYSHVKPGLRAYNVISHVIFYMVTHYGIDVIRVLHKSMDYQRHIAPYADNQDYH